jgi:amino acid transporter
MNKNLGFKELLALAIGGMVGGGIFTVLGIAVAMVGSLAPFAIALGGVVAWFAAYSYVKLGVYYKDEGATYSFFKRTYPSSPMAGSFIDWYTIFGYISTLALYAYTFSSYAISGFEFAQNELIRKLLAIAIIGFFAIINIWSVKGMGKIEDVMVYAKLLILFIISLLLIFFAKVDFNTFTHMIQQDFHATPLLSILIVSSVTFVAYEGFQLVINAVNEMENPDVNIPRAIYGAIILVALIYFIIALSAVLVIPAQDLIANKESALASGAEDIMGNMGRNFVIFGAILATSSAINGTLFGSSRQMARIANDGFMPKFISKRVKDIPIYAILTMASIASILIL